ncbi:hypothetical protein [Streptomyces sp. NPDC006355]|uniref:hypothetical protein n=1 Tax=Streptomyces sp. NPDC006355 TaxID=3156758 RepID=UPI00339FC77E
MSNCTDQIRSGAPGGSVSVDRAAVGEVLALMAGHFTARRPGDRLTPVALGAAVAGEVYNAGGRTSRVNGAALSAAVTDELPPADFNLTRGQYAVLLREAATAHGWSDDANERAIPTIPGPRPAPAPSERPDVPGPRPAASAPRMTASARPSASRQEAGR